MVEVTVAGDRVRFEVQGADRLLGLKNRIEVTTADICDVRREADFPTWWAGLRVPGTEIPGVLRIGSYYHHGEWTYWDVHWSRRDHVISIEIQNNRYRRLVIEVRDPDGAMRALESARSAAPTSNL